MRRGTAIAGALLALAAAVSVVAARAQRDRGPAYGMGLPDGVLRKVYHGNALDGFPGLDRSLFPAP